jgi:Mrp family chromosome partitioning ATPase
MDIKYKEVNYSPQKNKPDDFYMNDNEENSLFVSPFTMDTEMLYLYQCINVLLPEAAPKVIQLISSCKGEGTTTIVRELAKTLALTMEKTVLVVDANRFSLNQDSHYYIRQVNYGLEQVIKDSKPLDGAMYHVKNMNLYISPVVKYPDKQSYIFDTYKVRNVWDKLRQHFDIVLIDSPPVTVSYDGLSFCSTVDGTIMVLEADKTQWDVAKGTKEKILKNGGKILGIVFNKKQSYIPRL